MSLPNSRNQNPSRMQGIIFYLISIIIILVIIVSIARFFSDDYSRKSILQRYGDLTTGGAFGLQIGMMRDEAISVATANGWTLDMVSPVGGEIPFYDMPSCTDLPCTVFNRGGWYSNGALLLQFDQSKLARIYWEIPFLVI